MSALRDDHEGSMGWPAAGGLVVAAWVIALGPGAYVIRPIADALGLIPSTARSLAFPGARFSLLTVFGAGLPLLVAGVVLVAKGWAIMRVLRAFGAVLAFVVPGTLILAASSLWLDRLKPDVNAWEFFVFFPVFTLWYAASLAPYLLIVIVGSRLMRAAGWVR